MLTAGQLMDACGKNPFIFRAGVWKPRTSPRTYKGAGEEGLKWLQEVKQTYGIPVATEVATPEHVEAALKAGIDYLWIGARTSANPIAVEAIVEAIGAQNAEHRTQTDHIKAVLIKNPVNADAKLWLGNIERLEKTGVPVMVVHRGCGHKPCWGMAHEVRKARPDIPMLLDPSHMSGKAEQVPELLKKVGELGLDGAMIEVHCDPKHALSDSEQQLTPTQSADALLSIPCRVRVVAVFSTNEGEEELSWLRSEIDELDDRLWETIAARMEVSERIGAWKKAHDVAPLQPERYQHILRQRQQWAKDHGIEEESVKQIFDAIHEESLKRQDI